MDPNIVLIVVVAIAVVALVVVGWLLFRKARTKKLRARFGPEYDRAVTQIGDWRKAEDELQAREKRVEKLKLRALSPDERRRFAERWAGAQARFVDDPKGAVADANGLIKEVMQACGYPMGDFEQRAADISVEHPQVVSNYRAAREIAMRSAEGKANTEDMRQAFVHYRELFDELLETPQVVRVAR